MCCTSRLFTARFFLEDATCVKFSGVYLNGRQAKAGNGILRDLYRQFV